MVRWPSEKVWRKYRKYRKPLASIRRVRFINDIRRLGVSAAAGLRRMSLAETGGNWRKPSGIEGGGKITSLAVVEFAHARQQKPAAALGEVDQHLQLLLAVARESMQVPRSSAGAKGG
jgi:hypothetical protein